MKIWIDDVRPAPKGYVWCKSVNSAKDTIMYQEHTNKRYHMHTSTGIAGDYEIKVIDLDHDAGVYAADGGDYIKLLDWLEETNRNYPIHIHSMNTVGVCNMRAIIQHNNWHEV